jgi:hypothetical protein
MPETFTGKDVGRQKHAAEMVLVGDASQLPGK